MLISTALLLDSNIRNSVCTPAKLPCRRVEVGYQGREILPLGSVRESIMTPSETSSEKNLVCTTASPNDYAHRRISISRAKALELHSSFSGRNHRCNALAA
jgi:hypothetical protein